MHTIRFGLRAALLVAGLAVLTLTEAAGLNIHGLDPQLRASVGRIADGRSVILARTAPGLYTPSGTPVSVLSYTFAPYELNVGDMVRISLWGSVINNNAGAQTFSCTATGTNALGGTGVQLGGGNPVTVAAAGGNPNKYQLWRCDMLYAVAPPGATQAGYNFVPVTGAKAVTKGNTFSSGLQPLNNFGFYGGGTVLTTDQSLSGAVVLGGPFLTGILGSGGLGMRNPVIMDNSVSTRIDVNILSLGNAPITVYAGYIEGM
jgi:hypothetical protein